MIERKIENNKRARILKAATQVFAQNGFYNSKISQIAKLANVADGTIYLYFKNKDDILISLFEDEMNKIIKSVKDQINQVQGVENKLRKFIEKHLSLIGENREMAEVIQIELRQSHKFMKGYSGTKFSDYLNIISGIITQGQKDGEVREDIVPGVAKRILFGALDELSSYWVLSKNRKYSLQLSGKLVGDIFIAGIIKNPNE
ncbi:TetR family transcriptional regulator [candidate division KSB1 bacterium 4572_119]|nr:MAG: TetR family transcriptional regulator [candidate division KSB1 bacterium 4572_119]